MRSPTPVDLVRVFADASPGLPARENLAIVVGTVDAGEREVHGSPSATIERPFELGSIGKTFTATLLALAVVEGRIGLDDDVGSVLSAGANADVTFGELATHTAGLPPVAACAQWAGYDWTTPYAGYTPAMAEAALALTTLVGRGDVTYSNFGFQLLGLALERVWGSPLGDALGEHVFGPLGMTVTVNGAAVDPVAGHAADGRPAPAWVLDALPGPGGFAGTIGDLLTWAQAMLDPPSSPLGEAIRMTLQTSPGVGDGTQGLAWVVQGDRLVWHNGGTGGFHSMLAIDPASRRAAAAMVNRADLGDLDRAVVALLRRDPVDEFAVRPVDDAKVAAARRIAELILRRDHAATVATFSPGMLEAVPVERLAAAVDGLPPGATVGELVSATGGPDQTICTFAIDGTDGTAMLLALDDDGRVVGLLFQ